MSNSKLVGGLETDEEAIQNLADSLPQFFEREVGSGNYNLLSGPATQFVKIRNGLEDVEKASRVEKTENIGNLQELAKLVGTTPWTDESFSHYKTRVLSDYANITNEASINDLINHTSNILQTSTDNIKYVEPTEPGLVILSIPTLVLQNSEIEADALKDILENNISAGKQSVDVRLDSGTLLYISVYDYENNNYDSEDGYDGLDTDGNPKGEGGTYSGVI